MVMGILSPESRSISGKRVLTEGQEDITKRKIELTACITLVGEKFIYFFLRVWARKGEEIERVDSRGNFIACLTFGRRKGDGSISFIAAYDHRSEARSKSRSSDRRCKSDLPFGDPTNPQDSRGYFIRRLRLDYGGIKGGVRRFLSNPSRPLLVLMRSQWSVPSSGVDTVQTT